MKTKIDRASTKVTFQVSTDEQVMLKAYTHTDKKIVPYYAEANWSYSSVTARWRLIGVRVMGNVVSKTGVVSTKVTTERDAMTGGSFNPEWCDDTPDELMTAVINNAPGPIGVAESF